VFISFNAAPPNGTYFSAIYAGQVHCPDLVSSENDESSEAAFKNSLTIFMKALDLWLPHFTASSGTASSTNVVSGPGAASGSTSTASGPPSCERSAFFAKPHI
jgi:hypothetical protein